MKNLFTKNDSRLHRNDNSRYRHISARRLTLMLMAIAMMMLVPSAMKGQITTIDFGEPGTAAWQHVNGTPGNYATINMSSTDYTAIGGGAKVGNTIVYKYSNTKTLDISRLAFLVNQNGVDNATNGHDNSAGFYLRREKINNVSQAGLFTGSWENKIAVLNLNIGDKVTFYGVASNEEGTAKNFGIKYIQSVHANTGGDDIYNNDNAWVNSNTINITSKGDLIVQPNCDVYITSIVIEPAPRATYLISESADKKTSTFEFTGDGVLDDNDYAILNTSLSFGSTTDYLVVNDKESHMIKANGTETLETDANHDFQPSAGCFYTFKPTATGYIDLYGTLQGNAMHVFVYKEGWIDRANNNVFYSLSFGSNDISKTSPYTFHVDKGKTYYVCINNTDNNEHSYALHITKVVFRTEYFVDKLGVVVNNVDDFADTGYPISLTALSPAGGYHLSVKRCSANIEPSSLNAQIQNGWLYMSKPRFVDGADHAGTVIWNLDAEGGSDAIVVTFPYHASYNPTGYDSSVRSYGHTWNFIDPRNSDSNIGNSLENNGYGSWVNGTTTGILSIGQADDVNSQFYAEVQKREWTYSQRITGEAGGFHDPYYVNVWDMEGDNADMIWETEGLWFDTGSNLSCIYNENDAVEDPFKTNPLNFVSPGSSDPDRYVGLLPVTDDKKSSFTIPGLKPGDRVLIFMKSGEGSGKNGIFLNITGAKDALGKKIETNENNESTWYKAGGTNWQHNRYEGCYHFIKDETTDEGSDYGRMTFDMQSGSMCKLLYIRIYQGERISTTNIVSSTSDDPGKLLFINDKGAELGSAGSGSNMSLRFRGKGQQQKARVLTFSGNLNYSTSELKKDDSNIDSHFTVGGTYSQSVGFTSKVGEIGMFRLREMDMEYSENYVADFSDRNFTVGYRDKVDSYPYTWDFTDINMFSSTEMTAEANDYPIEDAAADEYGDQWDISLFDAYGKMKLNTGFDPITNNEIFAPHKIGNGNQLWAGGNVIPEVKGLWFYSEDDVIYKEDGTTESNNPDYASSLYNDCLEITGDGIHFCNTPYTDNITGKSRVAWWNYKMVVPDVPADGAVYLRMKRDDVVSDDAKTWSDKDNAYVPFVATRFQFASQSSKTNLFTDSPVKNGSDYSFYPVPNSDNEWILAVKNTTGNVEHLTFTLNGWIVKKVAVSRDTKTVNKFGWATESRARVIDPSLTSEMTGYNFETYIVTGASHADKTVTMTNISEGVYMPEASENGKQAYIIRNMDLQKKIIVNGEEVDNPEPGRVKVLNNGFNLFVPDMNDYVEGERTDGRKNQKTAQSVSDNMLLARLNGDLSQKDGDIYNYVLTTSTTSSSGKVNDYDHVVFARVPAAGMTGGKNVGYLPVDCSDDSSNDAKMHIIFAPWVEPEPITDAIGVPFKEVTGDSNAVYYNLNGQKIDGRPTEGGIYIMNGKKVVVK